MARRGHLASRHAEYFVELAEQAARGLQGADERAWVERTLPEHDNLRAAFEYAVADRDVDLALRLVTSLPELTHVRLGVRGGRVGRAVARSRRPEPSAVRRGGRRRRPRCVGASATSRVPDGSPRAPAAASRRAGTGRVGYPADVAADVALYEGDVDAAEAHYTAEVDRARRDADPIRLVWTLYYVAICHAVRRAPEEGVPAAQECMAVAGRPPTRPRGRRATTRSGSCSRSPTPTGRSRCSTRRRGSRRRCRTSGGTASR